MKEEHKLSRAIDLIVIVLMLTPLAIDYGISVALAFFLVIAALIDIRTFIKIQDNND